MDLLKTIRTAETDIYRRYNVRVRLLGRLIAGVPKTQDMIAAWIEARTKRGLLGPDEAARIKEEYKAEHTVESATEDAADASWRGFRRDEVGIYVEARQVKAMFRECAQVLGLFKNHRGTRDLLQHGVAVTARDAEGPRGTERIRFLRKDNTVVAEADGFHEAVVHAVTAQGPRSSIKRGDYVEDAELEFSIWVTDRGSAENAITPEFVAKVLALAQQNGLGADRSQGEGRFEVLACDALDHEPLRAPEKPEKAAKPRKSPKRGGDEETDAGRARPE